MADSLRIVIQVFDHTTMQESHGAAKVILTPRHQELIAQTTDQTNLAQWAAEELGSIISCLEAIGNA